MLKLTSNVTFVLYVFAVHFLFGCLRFGVLLSILRRACDNLLFLFSVFSLKVQSCKLYNNRYMIASTQITTTETFAFIVGLVFKLLSCKVFFINRKAKEIFKK